MIGYKSNLNRPIEWQHFPFVSPLVWLWHSGPYDWTAGVLRLRLLSNQHQLLGTVIRDLSKLWTTQYCDVVDNALGSCHLYTFVFIWKLIYVSIYKSNPPTVGAIGRIFAVATITVSFNSLWLTNGQFNRISYWL